MAMRRVRREQPAVDYDLQRDCEIQVVEELHRQNNELRQQVVNLLSEKVALRSEPLAPLGTPPARQAEQRR